MILDQRFGEMCNNLTDSERTELTLKFAEDMQLYILTIDELREQFVIPYILQVSVIISASIDFTNVNATV